MSMADLEKLSKQIKGFQITDLGKPADKAELYRCNPSFSVA